MSVKIIRDVITGRPCKYNLLSKRKLNSFELEEYMEVWETNVDI